MFKKIITICLCLIIFDFTRAIVKTCYHCNSIDDPEKCNPLNTSSIKPTECSSLEYPKNNNEANEKFVCVDYFFKNDTTTPQNIVSVTSRTCLKVANNDNKPCDEVNKDLMSKYATLIKCNSCETDNCNANKYSSGILHKASTILIGVLMFFVSLQ
ncbi:uncharacterized protein [Onthophagus taurus]|uniref:uncharacterized protein n=1 Tax=Onthophagus taurus TaxID=166361 RepID=UPI000C2010D5|nr:uncharacterized protein LOC111414312 [Onthophagus taurus]